MERVIHSSELTGYMVAIQFDDTTKWLFAGPVDGEWTQFAMHGKIFPTEEEAVRFCRLERLPCFIVTESFVCFEYNRHLG